MTGQNNGLGLQQLQLSGSSLTSTTVNGVNVALPAPVTYSEPTPAALPVFAVDYTGFSGDKAVAYFASILWDARTPADIFSHDHTVAVTATSSFQNGSPTLAINDLTATEGFLPMPVSGKMVTWTTNVSGGTTAIWFNAPFVNYFGNQNPCLRSWIRTLGWKTEERTPNHSAWVRRVYGNREQACV